MKVGVHVSISGKLYDAVDRAVSLRCDTFQIFSRNPRGWAIKELIPSEVEEFKKRREKAGISPVIVHIPYLINLGSPEEELYHKSISAYMEDIKRAEALGAEYFVTHIGNHKGRGEDFGIKRIAEGLHQVISETKPELKILLENTAGSGTSLGHTIEQLAHIRELVQEKEVLGLCLDTAHAFASGYNIREKEGLEELLNKIDCLFGLSKLYLIHANDSKTSLGSRVDRHADIGKGEIGEEGFRNIANHPVLSKLPFILETPKKEPGEDEKNIKTIRSLSNS